MWECGNCKEQIEDRYKHCWHCGKPKPDDAPESSNVKIHLKDAPAPEKEAPPVEESPEKKEIPQKEDPPKKEIPPVGHVPFEDESAYEESSASKIGKIVPPVLWLAALVLVAGFAYSSYQKTKAFENRLTEESASLGSQTNQFVFAANAPREKNAKIKAKILPLSAQTKQIDALYKSLPDDLRPSNMEEVKTLLWLDCKSSEAGTYEDGSQAFRDKCNAYLVDRNSSRVVQVQDFSGEPPPLKKQWGTSYASGKVLPETYISYIRENQPENERTRQRFASDSPQSHYWFKSELLYATILLIGLAAIGIGWLVFQIKSMLWKPE